MIAALYVATGGAYFGLDGVDPWDKDRDARLYAGPFPVVAHPPCERWGRFWFGGPQWLKDGHPRKKLGDDNGCFAAAVAAVRKWGGVLEHPADSHAWRVHGLLAPPRAGRWVPAGDWQGWTCCVSQGNYGHKGDKATWLYACGVKLPDLIWGHSGKRVLLAGLSKARARSSHRNRSGAFQETEVRDAAPIPRPTDFHRAIGAARLGGALRMTWVRVDDGFACDRRVLSLSDAAFRLEMSALCWSARQRTKGELRPSDLACAFAMLPNPPDSPDDLVRELVDAGLWASMGDGVYSIVSDNRLWRIDLPNHHRKRPYLRHRGLVYARDGQRCRYCMGTDHLSLDHLHPPRLGGTHDPDNLVTCCRPCNSRKGSRTPEQAGMRLLPVRGHS